MENFFHENAMYIVLGVSVLLWLGFSGYMFYIDKKISSFEDKLSENVNLDNEL